MIRKKKKIEKLNENLDKINYILSKNNVLELVELLGNSKKLIWRNFMAGISKGIGIGIGVTILSAVLIYLLQKIVRLNIPVIGEYISDIAQIVENSK
ncbi:MAG: hypothetical protein HFJ20_06845 [Clostridia bacterium]|nr:hypothetical protein [Clostridia bacterium]